MTMMLSILNFVALFEFILHGGKLFQQGIFFVPGSVKKVNSYVNTFLIPMLRICLVVNSTNVIYRSTNLFSDQVRLEAGLS